MVEQVPIAVGRRAQLLEEVGEQLRVIGVELRELLKLLRLVAVVREPMMRLRDADFRVCGGCSARGRTSA